MENKIKDIIETGPEDLFDSITSNFTELVKYADLFTHEDLRKSYLKNVNELYVSLMRNFRYFLAERYEKEIRNIFSEENETLPEIDTTTTIKIVKTRELKNKT